MARNPAVRKAAKAAKRKALVAEKRKRALAANSLASPDDDDPGPLSPTRDDADPESASPAAEMPEQL